MPTVEGVTAVQVVPDRWQSVVAIPTTGTGGDKSSKTVRRPTSGIVLKEETFASLQVITGNNENKLLVDAGSARKNGSGKAMTLDNNDRKRATDIYTNFLVQQISEERAEKQQILETFGEPYIFLFGERARVLSIQGVLLNTWDFNWEAEWWENYENLLRGTKCVENDARVFLTYDEKLVGGYILACTSSKNAQERNHVPLAFQMFVTSYVDLSNRIGDPSARPAWSMDKQVDIGDLQKTAPFRPTLLNGSNKIPNPDLGLVDSLLQTEAFNTIRGYFNEAIKLANKVAAAANSAVSQIDIDAVRVPIGYAGATVFDEQQVNVKVANTQITYTTFDENSAEYVGGTDLYLSSSTSKLDTGERWIDTVFKSSVESDDKKLMAKAKVDWHKAGYLLPEESLGPISTWLATKAVGSVMAKTLKTHSSPSAFLQSGLNYAKENPVVQKVGRAGGLVGIDGL